MSRNFSPDLITPSKVRRFSPGLGSITTAPNFGQGSGITNFAQAAQAPFASPPELLDEEILDEAALTDLENYIEESQGVCQNVNLANPDVLLEDHAIRTLRNSIAGMPPGAVGAATRNVLQKNIDLRYVQAGTCQSLNRNHALDLGSNLYQFDLAKLARALSGVTSADLQLNMACFINAITNIPNGSETNIKRLKLWFRDLYRVGKQGTENSILRGNLADEPEVILIKTSLPGFEGQLIREALVGYYMVNTLLKDYQLPNFRSIYSYFTCTSAVSQAEFGRKFAEINEKQNVISWCTAKGKSGYLVAENIQRAITFREFLLQANEADFWPVFLQVVNALNVANVKYGFTHFDLHDKNVLVQTMPNKVSIPMYRLNDNLWRSSRGINVQFQVIGYINTNYVARIIDYGFSHVKIGSLDTGIYGFEHLNRFPDQSYPMHDIYKLLGFSAEHLIDEFGKPGPKNPGANIRYPQMLAVINKIFGFFKDTNNSNLNVSQVLMSNKEVDGLFDINNSQAPPNITMEDFLTYLMANFDLSSYYQESAQYQMFPDPTPMSSCEFYEEFLAPESLLPTDFNEYCDMITGIQNNPKLTPDERTAKLVNLAFRIDLQNMYEIDRQAIDDGYAEINALIGEQGIAPENFLLPTITEADLNDSASVKNYNRRCGLLLLVNDAMAKYSAWIKSLTCVYQARGVNLPDLTDLQAFVKNMETYVGWHSEMIKDAIFLAKNTPGDQLPFWKTTLPTYLAAFE